MKEIYKKLFKIVLPISFQFVMMSLVSASDAFMLGFLDKDSLSAVSLATQIMFVFSLFFEAFNYGCSVLAAQYWGKGDRKTVEEVLAITMRYTLLVGFIFTLSTAFIPQQIMHALLILQVLQMYQHHQQAVMQLLYLIFVKMFSL